jgi:NAD(P)-dependent dehydrogenase (short-subunit alcohol dehydrogenase family)
VTGAGATDAQPTPPRSSNRVALITGCGKPIGIGGSPTAQGGKARAVALDVTQSSQCTALADSVRREEGRIDILVNSAGSAFRCAAEDFPEEKFDFIIDLNLKGTYLCCQAFGRLMLDQGKGSIINIASIGSFVAYPWASAYLASKGGALQVTRALALEWRDRGVRVNGIGPT